MKDEVSSLTMSDVSLTLLSDVTSDYANNKENQFKFKLSPSLFLPGSGWEVSIAIFPKMSLFKDLFKVSI